MHTVIISILLVLVSCSTLLAADPSPEGTAALVNGEVITVADFRGELARALRQRKKSPQDIDPAALAVTKKEALETLVSRELLYQESRKLGISINDTEVDAEISRLRAQFPSEEDFNASLGKMDLSREAVASQIRRGMAIQSLIESRFKEKAVVRENEVRSYYDSHQNNYMQPVRIRLSHILVKAGTLVTSSGTMPARTKIEEFRRRISNGEDFALLARESDDITSSSVGGDLGYYSPGELGKGLETAAFSLEAGQVSGVVEDSFGYHILKITERRPRTAIPFEEVREKIGRQLKQERLLGELTPFVKRLRKEARVEIHLSGEN